MNLTNLAIIVGAALLVSFAGNAQVIPITLRSHGVNQALPPFRPVVRIQSSIVSLASTLPASVPAPKAVGQRVVSARDAYARGGATPAPLPVTDQGAYPLSALQTPLLPTAPMELPKLPRSGCDQWRHTHAKSHERSGWRDDRHATDVKHLWTGPPPENTQSLMRLWLD